MRLVWQTVWHDLYMRRRNFILVLVISVVALYLLADILMIANQSNYQVYTVKKMLDKKLNYVRFEIIRNDEIGMMDYNQMALDFSSKVKEYYPEDYGYFMNADIAFAEYQGDGVQGQQDVFYVDETISDLCVIRDTEGNKISISQGTAEDGMLHVYVGYALRDQLPVGTVITNTYSESKMYVEGVLAEESIWLTDLMFGGTSVTRSLDGCIVSPVDETLLSVYITNSFNAQYVKCGDKEEAQAIIQNIRELAKEYGILLYCNTINEWIEEEKLENKEILESVGILTMFTVLIAVFAIGAASVADVYSRQYEFGIMYIHGVSSFQMFLTIFMENMVKLCIAGGIAIYFSGNRLIGESAYIHGKLVTPQLLVFIVAVGLATTWISYTEVKRHSMTDFAGGAYR